MATRHESRIWSFRLVGAGLAMVALLVGGAAAAHPSGGGGHAGGGHASAGHASGGPHGGYAAGGHYASAAPAFRGSYGYARPRAVAGSSAGAYSGGHGGYSGGHGGYSGGHGGYSGGHGGYSGGPGGYYGGHGGYYGGHGGYYGGHGGYYGGAARYYGGHGGYYGGHGGYYGGYYGGGWRGAWYGGNWYWWGGVYPLGLYFATLPLYYQTFWWGGVPYYYADYTFYRWNDGVREYEVVDPPAAATADAPPAAANEPYVYPRQGQSDEQLKQDRYQCYRWAADQTGFDPTRANGGTSAQDAAAQAGAYRRAEGACLEGRGYTVR